MKVCWFGCYDPEYSRNSILIKCLKENGVSVIECNETNIGWRRYYLLILKLRKLKNEYDILYCAFPSGYFVPLAWLFQRKPIVVDAFFPVYDAYVHDRKVVSKWSPKAIWFALIDLLTVKLADHVVVDTNQHKEYWQRIAPRKQYSVVPVGADTDIYFPIESHHNRSDDLIVTFYGSNIPLQGADKIVEAARLMQDKKVKFRIVGTQKLHKAVQAQWPQHEKNTTLIPFVSQQKLNILLNESDVILGIFGDTPKADRVIPNKVFQGLAVKKLVITKDTPAIREIFSPDELILIKNKPNDIVEIINKLINFKNSEKKIIKLHGGFNHSSMMIEVKEFVAVLLNRFFQ